MTAAAAALQPTVEERLTCLERAVTALVDELRDGWRCVACYAEQERTEQPEEPAAEPEKRTTAGADALAWMGKHRSAAPAAGRETEHEEHA